MLYIIYILGTSYSFIMSISYGVYLISLFTYSNIRSISSSLVSAVIDDNKSNDYLKDVKLSIHC
jgi:hypothetical protein